MSDNYWTHISEKSEEKNENKWHVGFFQKDDMVFAGVFDHILKNNGERNGDYEDVELFDSDNNENILLQTIREFVSENDFIYSYLIPNGEWSKNWTTDRPSSISWLKWKLTPRKKKFERVLNESLKKYNIESIAPFNDTWYATLYAGQNKKFIDNYYRRLGECPDDKPDCLYLSKEKISDPLGEMHTDFIKSTGKKSIHTLGGQDWKTWDELLNTFEKIIIANDGHIYIATKRMNKEQVESKIEKIARKNNLEITKDHILY